MVIIAQSAPEQLPEFLKPIREQFERGGSVGSILGVLLVTALLVFLVYALTQWLHNRSPQSDRNNPRKLFGSLTDKLGLDPSERSVLMRMAYELRLSHPTVLLLSPMLFDDSLARWGAGKSGRVQGEQVGRIRTKLFGPRTDS